jgi:hypothetical protein
MAAAKKSPTPASPFPPAAAPVFSVGRSKHGKAQSRKIPHNSWTMEKRKRFLDCLSITCNVRQSADFAAMSHGACYALRRRDPDFAAQFTEALETGYVRLEAALLEKATNGSGLRVPIIGDEELDGGLPSIHDIELPDAADIDPDIALRVLQQHYKMVKAPNAPRRPGRPPSHASEEETNAELVKRLKVLLRRQQKEAGDGDEQEA